MVETRNLHLKTFLVFGLVLALMLIYADHYQYVGFGGLAADHPGPIELSWGKVLRYFFIRGWPFVLAPLLFVSFWRFTHSLFLSFGVWTAVFLYYALFRSEEYAKLGQDGVQCAITWVMVYPQVGLCCVLGHFLGISLRQFLPTDIGSAPVPLGAPECANESAAPTSTRLPVQMKEQRQDTSLKLEGSISIHALLHAEGESPRYFIFDGSRKQIGYAVEETLSLGGAILVWSLGRGRWGATETTVYNLANEVQLIFSLSSRWFVRTIHITDNRGRRLGVIQENPIFFSPRFRCYEKPWKCIAYVDGRAGELTLFDSRSRQKTGAVTHLGLNPIAEPSRFGDHSVIDYEKAELSEGVRAMLLALCLLVCTPRTEARSGLAIDPSNPSDFWP